MADQFNILDYTEGPLLKTGQITDRTPTGRTTKDDGGFQRGIAGSKADEQYIVLTTGQYNGTTNVTVNAIVDAHTNECVFDKVTGLMWSRTLTPNIYGVGTEALFWDDTAGNDEDIFEFCDQANLSLLSGFDNWRIANILELQSLYVNDNTIAAPRLNKTAFPVWSIDNIYTSTSRAGAILQAFQLSFSTGNTSSTVKTTNRREGVLVRLGINTP